MGLMPSTLAVTLATAASRQNATNSDSYDPALARRAVTFAGAAYCSGTLGHGVDKWDCAACAGLPDVVATAFSSTPATDQNGFVAYDPHDGESGAVVVAFAGTDPLELANFIDDIDTLYTDYDSCAGCEVHEGFYNNWRAVADDVLSLVARTTDAHPAASLRITGHSLGAAVGVHCALRLAQLGFAIASVVTFGEPRSGNVAFADYVDAQLMVAPAVRLRVTHARDPAPHFPPRFIFGFWHSKGEVFYPGDSDGEYTVCPQQEDSTCSDEYLTDLWLPDHLSYLGFDFATNYLSCKL